MNKMKFLLLGQVKDLQSGVYILESIAELGHEEQYVDIREIAERAGVVPGQEEILTQIDELNYDPDIIIVLKGLELSLDTLKTIKAKFPTAKLVNWYFDIKAVGQNLWENTSFYPAIELYDFFLCSLSGVATKLREKGFKNVFHVGEACFPPLHGEQELNHFQEQKYGEDISFIGNLGYVNIHTDRLKILSQVIKDGFNIKIWGGVVGEMKSIPLAIRQVLAGQQVINERHSQVCQSSLINLGLDAMPDLEGSMSARIYRVMCSGGLYLSSPTKGLRNLFKINLKDEPVTADLEVVVFHDAQDLTDKLDFLLEHDDIRRAIAKNGQKAVLDKHKFTDRIEEIIQITKGEIEWKEKPTMK